LPTEVTPWVPIPTARRKPLQSTIKRQVTNPFSLLILPTRVGRKEYAKMRALANDVETLRTTDVKQLEKILSVLEDLGSKDSGVRAHDDSVVAALIAASFAIKSAKPKLSSMQIQQQRKSEQHRLVTQYGKDGAVEAEKTEEHHRKTVTEGTAELVSRRFEIVKLRDVLLYILSGCAKNALLPNPDAEAEQSVEVVSMETLFGTDETVAAAAAKAQARQRQLSKFVAGAPPMGVERRRGGEGFAAGLHLGVYLALHLATHAASSFWASLLLVPMALSTMYVPTMAGDEFAMILAASDYVGWYKCPNGRERRQ
jgi:hypothetical protein